MTLLKRPQIITPFETSVEGPNTLTFSTNSNEVEFVAKLFIGTAELRLVLPQYPTESPENITNSVKYFSMVDGELIEASFGYELGQVNFPLKEEFYIKFSLELLPNQLNLATLRVHDKTASYQGANLTASSFLEVQTEEVNLNINQNSSAFLGVNPVAPSVVYTDYKDSTVDVYWEDNNNIDASPIGSGYKVYYTTDQEDRISTYKKLNTPLISSYTENLSYKELIDSSTKSGTTTEFVEDEGLNTQKGYFLKYETQKSPAYYVKEEISSLVESEYTLDLSGNEGLTDYTAPFERVGTLVKVGLEENEVASFVSNEKVVFKNDWTASGVQQVEIFGSRLREIAQSKVYEDARLELITNNNTLSCFKTEVSFNLQTIPSSNTINFQSQGISTDLFEVEGLVVEFSLGASTQILEVVSWVHGLSVTFNGDFSSAFDTARLYPCICSEAQCEAYLRYLNKLLENSVTNQLTSTEIYKMIFDCTLIGMKFKGLSELYTYSLVDKEILKLIEISSIIVNKFPDLSRFYTYDTYFDVVADDFYSLIVGALRDDGPPVVYTPRFSYYRKTFIVESALDDYSGFYNTQEVYSRLPVYEEKLYKVVDTQEETFTRKDVLVRKMQLEVTNAMLNGIDDITDGRVLFFRVSFMYVDTARKLYIESPYSKEVFASGLSTDIVDVRPEFPSSIDIQKNLIREVLQVEPDINLNPGSITRSVFINPVSSAIENLNYREYFREVSQSFVSLLDFDGVTPLGESVPVNESLTKTQLREAYGLSNDETGNALIQEYVDSRFDLLASNIGVERTAGTKARGQVIFTLGVLPEGSNPVIVSKGSIVSTVSPKLSFITLNELRRDDFYKSGSKYTAKAFIEALGEGSSYVVPSNSITLIGASTVRDLQVSNASSTYGGRDSMTNKQLVELVRKKLLSVDTGTVNGYLYKLASMGSVDKAKVITSGNKYMRRDFDFGLNRKGSGSVDVYTKGLFPMGRTQRMGFFYEDYINVNVPFIENFLDNPFGTGTNYLKIDLLSGNNNLFIPYIDIFKVESISSLEVELGYLVGHSIPTLEIEGVLVVDKYNLLLPVNGDNTIKFTSGLNGSLTEGHSLSVKVQMRKEFTFSWEVKPFLSIDSAVDSVGNLLEEGINFQTYNNSYSLLERSSINEDSGLIFYPSPVNKERVVNFGEGEVDSGVWVTLNDCWNTDAPYIESVDETSEKFYFSGAEDAPFKIVIKEGYFYLNVRAPFNSEITEGTYIKDFSTYTIYYGRSYSQSKTLQVSYNTDLYVDSARFACFTKLVFTDEGEEIPLIQVPQDSSNLEKSYSIYAGDGDSLHFKLNSLNFNSAISAPSLKVSYYNNIPLGDTPNENSPSSGIEKSDYSVTLLEDSPYTLSHRGVNLNSIIVRPTSPIGVKFKPYTNNVDYVLRREVDKVIIERLPTGSMTDGQAVDIEYLYSNELLISYKYDLQVAQVTEELNYFSHAGSDFLVKRLTPLSIDIKGIVYLYNTKDKARIDSDIRRGINLAINKLDIGEDLYESDVVGIIENVSGVRNIKLKLSLLTVSEGEVRFGDVVERNKFSLYKSGTVPVYYSPASYIGSQGELKAVLSNIPKNEGGSPDKERSVYSNGFYYKLVSSPYEVSRSRGLAHISSSGSVYISFVDPENTSSEVEVTYQVSSAPVTSDIKVFPFQYLTLNKLELIYIEQ